MCECVSVSNLFIVCCVGSALCDGLITGTEESYRLCCVVVCDLETSRMSAPYIYDISRLRVNIIEEGGGYGGLFCAKFRYTWELCNARFRPLKK